MKKRNFCEKRTNDHEKVKVEANFFMFLYSISTNI